MLLLLPGMWSSAFRFSASFNFIFPHSSSNIKWCVCEGVFSVSSCSSVNLLVCYQFDAVCVYYQFDAAYHTVCPLS